MGDFQEVNMAWDTLQRWKESHNIDTSGYVRQPYIRPAIPKYTPWPAIAAAIGQIAPEFDPLRIAQRKIAMAQMPLEMQKLAGQQQLLPLEIQAQKQKLQWMMSHQGGIPGWEMAPNGTWQKISPAEQRLRTNQSDWQHTNQILEDSIRAAKPGASTDCDPNAVPGQPGYCPSGPQDQTGDQPPPGATASIPDMGDYS
jgi:hypothetical protein